MATKRVKDKGVRNFQGLSSTHNLDFLILNS